MKYTDEGWDETEGLRRLISAIVKQKLEEELMQREYDIATAIGWWVHVPTWLQKLVCPRLGFTQVYQNGRYRGIQRHGVWIIDHEED
jgi:hypothetical protein